MIDQSSANTVHFNTLQREGALLVSDWSIERSLSFFSSFNHRPRARGSLIRQTLS